MSTHSEVPKTAAPSPAALCPARHVRAEGAAGTAPRSPYGRTSTAEDVTAGLDLEAKTVLVTGATSGIGFETMRVLAARGAHVIGTGRTAAKAARACRQVGERATPAALELADFASVVRCAEEVARVAPRLDALICNAAVMGVRALERVNGVEKHFAVNHLGHFLLVARLMQSLLTAPDGRVVVVASNAYKWAPEEGIELESLAGNPDDYHWRKAYGQSKLANGLFARELARRLEGTSVTANSLHPGLVHTSLWRHEPWLSRMRMFLRRRRLKSVRQGAATSCYVATNEQLRAVSGYYFEDCNAVAAGGRMEDDGLAARLWQGSEALVADYLP